jgi:hypothetical protein
MNTISLLQRFTQAIIDYLTPQPQPYKTVSYLQRLLVLAFLFSILLLCLPTEMHAQKKLKKTSTSLANMDSLQVDKAKMGHTHNEIVYIELLGSGILGSINYDRRFSKSQEGLGFRVGIAPTFANSVLIPAHFNLVIGPRSHAVELGGGILYSVSKADDQRIAPSFVIAYRYQPIDSKISVRAGWMPTIYESTGFLDFRDLLRYLPGISLGIKF